MFHLRLMNPGIVRSFFSAAILLVAIAAAGCAPGGSAADQAAGGPAAHASAANADPKASIHYPTAGQAALGITQPYSDADIAFMTGMIPHHAQAVIMAGWAPTHGAREDVAILCERIAVGQRDEIRTMSQWLADRGLPVPDPASTRMHMKMNGAEHDMLMPGMLSDAEMAALDKARGAEFDRLFLQGMIKHHQGAIDMVNTLMKSYGAAQDDSIFKFQSDVYADQTTEISVMQRMLESGGS